MVYKEAWRFAAGGETFGWTQQQP